MDFNLDSYKKETQFNVPNGYFDTLSEQIMKRVCENDRKRLIFRRKLFTSMAVAASLALLIVAGFLFTNLSHENPPTAPVRLAKSVTEVIQTEQSNDIIQEDNLLAQNEMPESAANIKHAATHPIPDNNTNVEESISKLTEQELKEIDSQMLDFYSDEMVFNDWWEL